jgi:hypothetical protein
MKTDSQQSETVAEAKSEATLAAPSGSVFEVVDSSNEETYWTLGIWPTLQEALAALDVENPEDVGCNEADEYDEHRTIEVRERKIGWGGSGRRVAKVEWKATWDEPADEYKWARVQTLNAPGDRLPGQPKT